LESVQLLSLGSKSRWMAARHCMALGLCLSAHGCLVSLPPVDEDERERPNLSLSEADPPLAQVLVVQRGQSIKFTIPVEHRGTEAIYYAWWLNWTLSTQGADSINWELAAFDVTTLTYQMEINRRNFPDDGCQQLTFMATDESNASKGTGAKPENFELVAMATWWVNIVVDVADGQTLVDCPTVGAPPLD